MSDPRAASVATWNAHAPRYRTQEPLERGALRAAVRIAAVAPHERLVDLGTGTGALLAILDDCPHRPRDVTGVDRSPAMLARAAGRLPHWPMVTADARAVPLPDACADVVTCAYVLHLLGPRDRAAVLAEAHRLLAPSAAARLVLVTVWARRRAIASTLAAAARARPAAWGGLAPVDPTADLVAAGFRPRRRVELPRGGYPSLVLYAQRDTVTLRAAAR